MVLKQLNIVERCLTQFTLKFRLDTVAFLRMSLECVDRTKWYFTNMAMVGLLVGQLVVPIEFGFYMETSVAFSALENLDMSSIVFHMPGVGLLFFEQFLADATTMNRSNIGKVLDDQMLFQWVARFVGRATFVAFIRLQGDKTELISRVCLSSFKLPDLSDV